MDSRQSDDDRRLAARLAETGLLRDKLDAAREYLAAQEVFGTAEGVTVVFSGTGMPLSVAIDPQRLDTTNVRLLERRLLEAMQAGGSSAAAAIRHTLTPVSDTVVDLDP